MRLVFPGREHADISLNPGELSFGRSGECDVQLAAPGWSPHLATLTVDPQRGLWLRVESGQGLVHVNARPIREHAMVRLGDVVNLGEVRFCVMLDKEDAIVRELPSHRSLPRDGVTQASAVRAVLRSLAGPFHGRTFPLGNGLLIGSAADADIQIDDAGLAPHHARITLRHDQVILRAEKPGNKLRVNGEVVENAVLHPDDQLAIEPHRFVVEAPGLPPRGVGVFTPRQRPITQTIPAVPDSAGAALEAEASATQVRGRSNLGWLLLAAASIAGVLAFLLIYAPR